MTTATRWNRMAESCSAVRWTGTQQAGDSSKVYHSAVRVSRGVESLVAAWVTNLIAFEREGFIPDRDIVLVLETDEATALVHSSYRDARIVDCIARCIAGKRLEWVHDADLWNKWKERGTDWLVGSSHRCDGVFRPRCRR